MEVTTDVCPRCGGTVSQSGIAPYRYCESEDCDFFEKEPERMTAADSQGMAGERP